MSVTTEAQILNSLTIKMTKLCRRMMSMVQFKFIMDMAVMYRI